MLTPERVLQEMNAISTKQAAKLNVYAEDKLDDVIFNSIDDAWPF